MARLSSIVDSSFILTLANKAKSATGSSNNVAAALQGKGGDSIQVSLRRGAQTFSLAMQGLSSAAAFVNLAEVELGKLDKIVVDMEKIVERAKSPGTGVQGRQRLEGQYRDLVTEFRSIVDGAEFQGQNYLKRDGLENILRSFGLDSEESDAVAASFAHFVTPDDDTSLASDEVKARKAVNIPADAFLVPVETSTQTTTYDTIFDEDRTLKKRPEAYRIQADLKELRNQISENVKALGGTREMIIKNMDLVRAAGLSFLDGSNLNSIEDAEAAAKYLQREIRRRAPGSLSQLENLEPITIATLLLAENGFKG